MSDPNTGSSGKIEEASPDRRIRTLIRRSFDELTTLEVGLAVRELKKTGFTPTPYQILQGRKELEAIYELHGRRMWNDYREEAKTPEDQEKFYKKALGQYEVWKERSIKNPENHLVIFRGSIEKIMEGIKKAPEKDPNEKLPEKPISIENETLALRPLDTPVLREQGRKPVLA